MTKERFSGRGEELSHVLELVGAPNAQSVSIVADPGFGRSALLRHLASEAKPRVPTVFALLELGELVGGQKEFYQELVRALARARVEIEAGVLEQRPEAVLESALGTLSGEGKRLVVLCDDFHRVTKDSAFSPSFFEFLRAMASAEANFAIVTSSNLPLLEMCSTVELAGSPFFNIFSTVRLGPLRRTEVAQLLSELAEAAASHTDDDLLAALWDLTGGCPLLVEQAAGRFLSPSGPLPASGQAWEQALAAFLDESEQYYDLLWTLLSDREQQVCLAASGPQGLRERVPVGLKARGLLADRGRSNAYVPYCFAFKRFLLRKQGKDARFVHPRRRGLLGYLLRGWRGTSSGDES